MRINFESLQIISNSWGIIFIFLGMSILSLQTPANDFLVPYAPYLQDAILIITFCLIAFFLKIKIRNANCFIFLGLFALFGMALASSFWSYYPEEVFIRSLRIFGSCLIICTLTLADPRPIVTFKRLAKGLALFGMVMSLIGLIGFFFGSVEHTDYGDILNFNFIFLEISQRTYEEYSLHRISSMFGNPNTFAAWLLVTLPMTIYLISTGSNRMVYGLLALIQGVSIIFTFSRAGIMALVIFL